MDGSLLLPYSQISINTIEFSKRLPYNTIEKARRVSDVYMSIYIYTYQSSIALSLSSMCLI